MERDNLTTWMMYGIEQTDYLLITYSPYLTTLFGSPPMKCNVFGFIRWVYS